MAHAEGDSMTNLGNYSPNKLPFGVEVVSLRKRQLFYGDIFWPFFVPLLSHVFCLVWARRVIGILEDFMDIFSQQMQAAVYFQHIKAKLLSLHSYPLLHHPKTRRFREKQSIESFESMQDWLGDFYYLIRSERELIFFFFVTILCIWNVIAVFADISLAIMF